MNRILREAQLDETCAYKADQQQLTHYLIIDSCSSKHNEALIERGWRRFGAMFFRPVCVNCHACETLKIDALRYTFSKSERRIMKKAAHFTTKLQHPTVTTAHIELFDKYHRHMKQKRDWEYQRVTINNYYMSFVNGFNDFGYEVLYYDDDKLIAVDLIDIVENGISSVYCYYDPDYERYSLGKYSLLRQIKYAQKEQKQWIHLGYFVDGCQSLQYKRSYDPLVRLIGRPSDHETPDYEPLPPCRPTDVI